MAESRTTTALRVLAWLGWAVAAALALRAGRVPPLPPLESAAAPHGSGWVADADAIAANLDPGRTQQFDRTPAGRVALGEADVFLWQAVRKAAGRPSPWYANIDQKGVGCCVGCGWKHSADVCQAAQIAAGSTAAFKPVSAEVIYAGSRVAVGGGRLRGDGSVGAWAAKWCSAYGVVPMEQVGASDLTDFDPQRRGRGEAAGCRPTWRPPPAGTPSATPRW